MRVLLFGPIRDIEGVLREVESGGIKKNDPAARARARTRGTEALEGPAPPPPPPGSDHWTHDIEVVDAPVSIAKSADPVRAARATPEASIVQAARAVAEGRADALVCAGGTGAALAAGLFNVKRARGILRPALALPLPVPRTTASGNGRMSDGGGDGGSGSTVTLLDVGANAQARPEHLVQFAFMGAALAHTVLGVPRPRVALLSNGEEQARGAPLVLEAAAQLRERLGRDGIASGALPLQFVGNVEGGDVTGGAADVIVTDGFTGNIALKLIEGVSQTILASIRASAESTRRAQVGGLLLRPALREFRDEIDPEAQGGAYLLGLRRLGVVPHGRFTQRGFAQAILRAAAGAREDVVGRTHLALEQAGALRGGLDGRSSSAENASLRGDDS